MKTNIYAFIRGESNIVPSAHQQRIPSTLGVMVSMLIVSDLCRQSEERCMARAAKPVTTPSTIPSELLNSITRTPKQRITLPDLPILKNKKATT